MSTDEGVRIGWFVMRLMKIYFLSFLMRFVIEKPDSLTCIGFEMKLQIFEFWRDLRLVEGHPFQLESDVRKIINTKLSFNFDVYMVNVISQVWL